MNALLVRIMIAGLLGFIIGLANKSMDDTPSGVVLSIICMGAALISITSMEYYRVLELPWISDPGRLSAQVISALGFLGTGMIWISQDQKIQGLSMAASLWVTSILGLLIGTGEFLIAVLLVLVLILVNWLAERI